MWSWICSCWLLLLLVLDLGVWIIGDLIVNTFCQEGNHYECWCYWFFFLFGLFFWVFSVFKNMLDIKFSIIQFGMIESVHDFPVTDYSYSWFGSWGIDSWWFHQIKYEFWYTAFLPVCFLGALVVFIHDEYKVFFPLGYWIWYEWVVFIFSKVFVYYIVDSLMISLDIPFFSQHFVSGVIGFS